MSEWNYALLHSPVLGLPAVLLRPWPLSSTAQTACVLHPGDEAAEAELAQDDEAMAEVATALQRVDMTFLCVLRMSKLGMPCARPAPF